MSDNEEEIIYLVDVPRTARKFRIRPNHYVEWNGIEFLNRFRLSKQTVDNILTQIEGRLQHPTNRNHAVEPLLQLLMVLRFYATVDMLRAVGDFGGIHVLTMSRIVKRVSTAIHILCMYLISNLIYRAYQQLIFHSIINCIYFISIWRLPQI